ncbi:MAG: glutaminyl-peptide cyclotransferase [Micromonosporaceae bacterium]
MGVGEAVSTEHGTPVRRAVLSGLCLVLILTGCAASEDPGEPRPREWDAAVVATYPHDPDAFTQGLEIHDGQLYEATGLYGKSWIATSDIRTGTVSRRVELPDTWFGEGLTLTGAGIWQVTWRNHIAVLRDRTSLKVRRQVRYDGEGWGICHQASTDRLVMSDGSAELTFRDPATFSAKDSVTVTLAGRAQDRLNELECVGGYVWANVFERHHIVRIDLDTGRVTDVVHVPERHSEGVLNGIAALPGTDDLLVTGKNWPSLYRITPRARAR